MKQKLRLSDLAWPIFVENFLTKSIGIINIFLFSSFSKEAVAAIGVSNQLINFINMIFLMVTLGTAVIISQNLGAGNKERASAVSSAAIILNVGIGIFIGLIVLLFHHPILSMMGLTGLVMEYTNTYFTVIGGMCVLQGINLLLATIMRNYGHARAPMLVFFFMNILNLIGNTIIILHPFGMASFGIKGVAVWTAFSQIIGTVIMVLCAHKYDIRLHIKKTFPVTEFKKILSIGIPGAGDAFAYSVAQICLTFFVTPLGDTALASFTYALNFFTFVQLMGYSVGQGTQILAGREIGAGNFNAAYRMGFRSTWIAMSLNIIASIMLIIFQKPVLHLFTSDREIISTLFWCIAIDFVLEFGRSFNLVIGVCVRGSGDVKWAIVASFSSILLVQISLGYVFTHIFHLGVPGAFIAVCADEWVRGQLMTWRWRSRRWEKAALVKQVLSAQEV